MRALFAWAVVCSIALISCSDDTTTPTNNSQPTLTLTTSMETSSVLATSMGGGSVQDDKIIDSIKIQSVRILISKIKLHTYGDDLLDMWGDWRGWDAKAGPAVITFTKDKRETFFSVPIPVGKYDRIKMEMHKFNSVDADSFRSDSIFVPFIEPERVTVIVDGTVYIDTVAVPFSLTDDQTENFWLEVYPYFEVVASSNTNVEVNFNPVEAFRIDGKLLDPRERESRGKFHGRMKKAFRCHRR